MKAAATCGTINSQLRDVVFLHRPERSRACGYSHDIEALELRWLYGNGRHGELP